MDPDRVGEVVARLLTAASPTGVRVSYDDGMLSYFYDGEFAYMHPRVQPSTRSYWRDNIDHDNPIAEPGDFAGVCFAILDQFQDFVAEATGTAWPGSSHQPGAGVDVIAGNLRLFYGAPEDPVLVVGVITPG